jgi:peroxiredoxin
MKIYRPGISLILLCFCVVLKGQTVSISGSGTGYKNAELKFYLLTDPITKRFKPISRIKCDEKGKFSYEVPCPGDAIIFIKTGIYNFHLYVAEGSGYELLLPDYASKSIGEEQNPFFIETELIPEVINNQSDVNNLIRIFDSEYNQVFNFVAECVFRNYKKDEIKQQIARLEKFSQVKTIPFYDDYVKCRMIMLNLIASSSNQPGITASQYINAYFKSDNQAFTDLAEQMFSGYFNNLSSGPLKEMFNRAIGIGSFTELQSVIIRDKKITNKELADFVLLLNLNADYYERNLPGENVRKIISIMKSQGESDYIKNIASTMLEKINSTLPGNIPPDISLLNSDGKLQSLKDFRGKYLLLNFARADNMPSITELGIINMWLNKYISDFQVVTIITDKNFKSSAESFKKRGFNWTFLDGSEYDNLEFLYDIKMYPSFLLLDREGKIIADPCPYPSEDLELTIRKSVQADPKNSASKN